VSEGWEQHSPQSKFIHAFYCGWQQSRWLEGTAATQLEDMVRVDGQFVADAGLSGIEGNYHELLMATARHQPPLVQIHVFIVHHVL